MFYSHVYSQGDEDTDQAFAMTEDHPFPAIRNVLCIWESVLNK